MRKTIGSVSALIALSAATASAEIRAAPFSDIGLDISYDYSAFLDMDGDSNDDFEVWRNGGYDILSPLSFHEVVVDDLVAWSCTRFAFGADIGASGITDTVGFWSNWVGLGRSYAGIKLVGEGTTNWGWIEFQLPDFSTGMVVRGAWETITGKSIPAGVWPGSVAPSNGPFAGGNTVLVTNGIFRGAVTNVTVGGMAADIQASGTNWVRITMPATGSAGAKVLVIETVGGDRLQVDGYTVNPAGSIGSSSADWSRWEEIDGLPERRTALAAATWNGRLYAIGGRDGVTYNRTNMFVFNGTSWQEVEGLPTQRYYLAVGTLGGELHAIAGWTGGAVTNVYRYNGTNWLNVAGLPSTMAYHGVGIWDNELYAIGGVSGAFARTNVFRFNGTNWSVAPGLPGPRNGLAAATLGGAIYAVSGNDELNVFHTNVYRFNGTDWQEVAGLPAPRFELAATTLGESIYAIGGRDGGGARTNVYRYDGTNWQEVAGLPVPRYELAAATYDDAIYAIGGRYDSSTFTTNVYRYPMRTFYPGVSPSSGSWTGNYEVVIVGTNLGNGVDITNVTLCGASVASIVSQSATQVVVLAGDGVTAGLGDVRVFSTSFGETVKSNAFSVSQGDQVITFPAIPSQYVTRRLGLAATAGSGLPVNFAILSGPAVLADGTNVTFTDAGLVRVVASQGGDANWNAALDVTNAFEVRGSTLWTDYDGDHVSDMAVCHATNGDWYIRKVDGDVLCWATNFGNARVVTVPGDYDGDGAADLAVYDYTRGNWYAKKLSGEVLMWRTNWGFAGAMPVAGDYDGDGVFDLAVYDETHGNWYVRTVAGQVLVVGENWGFAGAMPVAGDYNGDGTADLAVYDRERGNWYVRTIHGDVLAQGTNWGFSGATPVPGDYDADGTSDQAVYDEALGNWYIRSFNGPILLLAENWGFWGAVPVPGDYDGDGFADLAVYGADGLAIPAGFVGNWYIRRLTGEVLLLHGNWGSTNFVPVNGE